MGDRYGNIATGAKTVFSDQLVGFSLITGTSGTGNTISLTLDADLNNAAYNAMAGQKGAVALYNYRTGDILCMLSTPAYDPDDKAEIARVDAGDSKYDGAYLNRFLSSTYTPGSTFKLVTSAAALETLHNESSFSYTCSGSPDGKRGEDHLPQRSRQSELRQRAGQLLQRCIRHPGH